MNTKTRNNMLSGLALAAIASSMGQPSVAPNPGYSKGSYRGQHGANKRRKNRRRNRIAKASRRKNR